MTYEFLKWCFLDPKTTPPWLQRFLQEPIGLPPPGYSLLLRPSDFRTAPYVQDLRQQGSM